MKIRTLFVSFCLPLLCCALAPVVQAQDGTPTGIVSDHRPHAITKRYPNGWKPLHPHHAKITLPKRSTSSVKSAVQPLSTMQSAVMSAGVPQQPIAQNLPLWEYSIVAAQDGNTYQGYVIGRSPYYNGHRTTTVQAYLVPVIITTPDGGIYDPTASDNCIVNPPADNVMDEVENSPLFQTTDFTFTDQNGNNPVDVGVTQATDAYQRANFWQVVSPNANTVLPYHTLVNATTLPAVNISVPPGYGFTNSSGPCGPFAEIDYNWWDSYVVFNLIPSLSTQGVGPTSLPIFIFDSVAMYLNDDTTQCCAMADHGSVLNPQNELQTYIVTDFDTSGAFPNPDIQPLSHEMGEWVNDPDNSNPTPSWGNPTYIDSGNGTPEVQDGCQSVYEVGDGLDNPPYVYSVTMPNGVIYSPQELVFFSWFYNQAPSIGAGGWYSDQGSLTTFAGAICQ